MGFFEMWVLHLGLFFHFNLKYPNLYLPLPIGILGFIAIPTPILTFTNWNFGVLLALVFTFTNWDFGA